MNQLTKVFKGSEIRMIGNNTAPLFVASDVAKALGYKEPHIRQSVVTTRVGRNIPSLQMVAHKT